MYSRWPQVGEPCLHPPPMPKLAFAPRCTIHPPPVRKSHGGVAQALTGAGLISDTAKATATRIPPATSADTSLVRTPTLSIILLLLCLQVVARKRQQLRTRPIYRRHHSR